MKNRLIIVIFIWGLFCMEVYPYKVNSPITLKKYCLWKPICCAKMVSAHHPDTLIRCADIDYLRWACAPNEDIYTIAERIDTGFVFHVQDSIYEREMKDAVYPVSIIDSLFLHEGIKEVVNRYFVFYQDNWYLKVWSNQNGEAIIATKHPLINDLQPNDTCISSNIQGYLLFRLQQEHMYCCIDVDLLNVILIHQEDLGCPASHIEVR